MLQYVLYKVILFGKLCLYLFKLTKNYMLKLFVFFLVVHKNVVDQEFNLKHTHYPSLILVDVLGHFDVGYK